MAAVLKCKMCGGDIAVGQNMTVGTCLFCGSTMTLPRIDSDKKARLFNRANQYRLNNEFDKAYDAYEAIVAEDESESEAYWGLILSEYGVEYVEDPRTKKRKPTCHRTQAKSVFSTVNYERALRYADTGSRMMYQEEAEALDRIQRGILAMSEKEDPYDVFICYKEREDATGERTEDSVLAQSIFDELTKQNIRCFFARVTLEDKLGTDYEPYIYSALKSSRVMLVVTTSAAHCNAVWVRNEWNRFLAFMEEAPGKVIVPVFRDMSPYELPPELSKYQSQDMGKVGAMQDILHGVKDLLGDPVIPEENYTDHALRKLMREHEEEKLEKKRRRKRRTIVRVIVALFLVFAGLAGWFYWQNSPRTQSVGSTPDLIAKTPEPNSSDVAAPAEDGENSIDTSTETEGQGIRLYYDKMIYPGESFGYDRLGVFSLIVYYGDRAVEDFTVEHEDDSVCSITKSSSGVILLYNFGVAGQSDFTVICNGERACFTWVYGNQ